MKSKFRYIFGLDYICCWYFVWWTQKGSFEFSVQNNNMIGTAEMYNQPADGKVYEAWFEDNQSLF